MPKIDLLPCPFCCGKAEAFPLDKCDSYGNHERLWYSECGECFARSGYYNTEGEAAIAWNTRSSGWIPCSERLPEVREKVLALYDYCTCEVRPQYIMIASLAPDGYWMEGCTWHPPQSVNHWMPLPEPPKEE